MDWAGEATALGEQEDGEREVARALAPAQAAPHSQDMASFASCDLPLTWIKS